MGRDKAEKVFEKLAAPSPSRFVGSAADFAKRTGQKAKDEVQQAADQFLQSDFAKRLGIFGAGLIISQFIEEMIKYLNSKNVQAKSPKYYKKMLQENKSLQKEDPKEVAALWETLYRTSPSMAKDPVAAGAFIRQSINKEVMQEHGGPPIDTYKTLIDIEKGKSDNQSGNIATKFIDMFAD